MASGVGPWELQLKPCGHFWFAASGCGNFTEVVVTTGIGGMSQQEARSVLPSPDGS